MLLDPNRNIISMISRSLPIIENAQIAVNRVKQLKHYESNFFLHAVNKLKLIMIPLYTCNCSQILSKIPRPSLVAPILAILAA
jgi:hypothetical protein